MQGRRRAEGERRESPPRRPGTGRPTGSVTRRRNSTARAPTASPTAKPIDELAHDERAARRRARRSACSIASMQPMHEQDRDRVVDAGLALERARQPAAQRRAAQDGEDGGGVGGGHGRAEQQRLERFEVEQQRRGDGGQHGGAERAERGERDRGPEHGPDLAEAGRQAALEEDEGQRDHAGRARQLEVVVESCPKSIRPRPSEPMTMPSAEHEHEARHAKAPGGQRGRRARQPAGRRRSGRADPRSSREPCQKAERQVSRLSCAGSDGGGGVSSSAPSTPALLTAGLAGATVVRAASHGASSPSASRRARQPRRLLVGPVEHAPACGRAPARRRCWPRW